MWWVGTSIVIGLVLLPTGAWLMYNDSDSKTGLAIVAAAFALLLVGMLGIASQTT